jgi:hypothetical protein
MQSDDARHVVTGDAHHPRARTKSNEAIRVPQSLNRRRPHPEFMPRFGAPSRAVSPSKKRSRKARNHPLVSTKTPNLVHDPWLLRSRTRSGQASNKRLDSRFDGERRGRRAKQPVTAGYDPLTCLSQATRSRTAPKATISSDSSTSSVVDEPSRYGRAALGSSGGYETSSGGS